MPVHTFALISIRKHWISRFFTCSCAKLIDFYSRKMSLCWSAQTDLFMSQLLSELVHFGCLQFWQVQCLNEASKLHLNGLYNFLLHPSIFFSFTFSRTPHYQLDFCTKKRNKTVYNLTSFKQWNEFWCMLLENSLSILCFHWDFFSLYQLKAFGSHLLTDKVFKLKCFSGTQLNFSLFQCRLNTHFPYTLNHRIKRPFLLFSKTICFFCISVYFHSIHPDFILCSSAPTGVGVNFGFMLWPRVVVFSTVSHKLKLTGVKSIQHPESSSLFSLDCNKK